jgi:hypothetical protein
MYRADTLRTHNSRYSWVGRIISERYVYMSKHEVLDFLCASGMDSCGSGRGQAVGSCECGIEHSGSIK